MTIIDKQTGDWYEIKGVIKNQWGKLTDDDIASIDGSRDKLVEKLMDIYNLTEIEAEDEIERYWSDLYL